MNRTESTRTARIEARIAPEALGLVRRAAELQGRSVSDFVVSAAQEAARRTVAEIDVLNLAVEAQTQIVDLLLNPPAPNTALSAAFKKHRALVIE